MDRRRGAHLESGPNHHDDSIHLVPSVYTNKLKSKSKQRRMDHTYSPRASVNDPLRLPVVIKEEEKNHVRKEDRADGGTQLQIETTVVPTPSDTIVASPLEASPESISPTAETYLTPRDGRAPGSRLGGKLSRRHRLNNSNATTGTRRRKKTSDVSIQSVVQRASRKAALSTKQAVWDSNDISVDAAVRAVDQWEALYNALKQCSLIMLQQAQTLYQATKLGASQMEKGISGPVRDWIVLPAFGGMEQAVLFLQSDRMHYVARQSLDVVRMVPVLGEHVFCPAIYLLGGAVQKTWKVVQYPIPSKQQVRDSVGFALDSSKWALMLTCRELFWYIKRADAGISRSLSHTQWKVMGSGPYVTLDDATKQEVLAHITERYCSLHPHWTKYPDKLALAITTTTTSAAARDLVDQDFIHARYEFAADIKRHNPILYQDLIRSGLLLQRSGILFQDDEWLKPCPVYRYLECNNFLIPEEEQDTVDSVNLEGSTDPSSQIMPLWFHLPNVNGKPPPSDTPWVCFAESDQHSLEDRYRKLVLAGEPRDEKGNDGGPTLREAPEDSTAAQGGSEVPAVLDKTREASQLPSRRQDSKHPTLAQWYVTDPPSDVLVDQKRQAVSFRWCQKSVALHNVTNEQYTESVQERTRQGRSPRVWQNCRDDHSYIGTTNGSAKLTESLGRMPFIVPPPIIAVMKPTLWRFHGSGDAVIRSNWFLDTPRNGLQPFDEDAQTVLEDAYLFLKWMSIQKHPSSSKPAATNDTLPRKDSKGDSLGGELLTIEVTCPDGKERLIQFGSLTQATAIQKGFSAAISINKLRVYRGAWLPKKMPNDSSSDQHAQHKPMEVCVQESIVQAAAEHGVLGDTQVPDTCLRSILQTPRTIRHPLNQISTLEVSTGTLTIGEDDLAVPTPRLFGEDMARFMKDPIGGPIHHLCLIVHGIGEMMQVQSIDLFGLAMPNLSTIVDCCNFLRKNHTTVQATDSSHSFLAGVANDARRQPIGRVEYLPVEWHEAFSILSQRRTPTVSVPDTNCGEDHVMLKDISLPTIPKMREFANDTLMDVLYFMSPEHHDIIIDIVTNEMNVVVEKLRQLTGFSGSVSIIGHSLGSIISWDILSNQRLAAASNVLDVDFGDEDHMCAGEANGSSQSLLSDYGTARSEEASEGPETDRPPLSVSIQPAFSYPQLDFQVENFFLMGSPVAVFLMIRNQRKPLHESFYLSGCRRVFNIFHPYDVRSLLG